MNAPLTTDPPSELGVSIVRDDLLFRLQRAIGLVPREGLGLVRRALFWSLLAWLPVAVWAWYRNRLLGTPDVEPLIVHYGIHTRFLVAVPLFILAEGLAHTLGTRLVPYFVRSGIVPEPEVAKFRAALARAIRLRNSTLPWIAILAIVVAAGTVSEITGDKHELGWAAESQGYGFGGWWLLWVGRPIYLTLALAWVWRIVLLFLLFRSITRLDLSIVPTHPDRAGGLGFVERIPVLFAPVAFAVSAVLASRWAHDVVYHGLSVLSLKAQMIAFLVLGLLLFLSPLLVFAAPLSRAKKQALLDYGALVGGHGRLVHQRWIDGREVADDAVLNAPEIGPVADAGAAYDAVKSMRTVPLGKTAIAPIALALAAPMLGVVALQVPVKELVLGMLKALM